MAACFISSEGQLCCGCCCHTTSLLSIAVNALSLPSIVQGLRLQAEDSLASMQPTWVDQHLDIATFGCLQQLPFLFKASQGLLSHSMYPALCSIECVPAETAVAWLLGVGK